MRQYGNFVPLFFFAAISLRPCRREALSSTSILLWVIDNLEYVLQYM